MPAQNLHDRHPVLALLALAALGASPALAQPEDWPEAYTPAPLTAEQLYDLVAPVALYPDGILDSLLPASVAPADVAAAARYVSAQPGSVYSAPHEATWEVSVVALLQFPEVLLWMGQNPAWVEQMGFAVATQQEDVLLAIQRYRAKAHAVGALRSNEYIVVESGPVIVIRPVYAHIVYVPVYDPWILDAWRPGRAFYRSWITFSFGSRGFWGRFRISWGSSIYDYGDPWWWGSWRSVASDWGRYRPTRWTASRYAAQPWYQSTWGTRSARVRPSTLATAPATRQRAAANVIVAPPPPRAYSNTQARSRTTDATRPASGQRTAPAVPVTRWTQPRTTPTPDPRATRVPVAPTPAPTAPQVRREPPVLEREPAGRWSQRGQQSLEGQTRRVPAPTAPQRPTPERVAPQRVPTPEVRSFPPRRPNAPVVPDAARERALRERGERALSGA